jgi:hypothetical protein
MSVSQLIGEVIQYSHSVWQRLVHEGKRHCFWVVFSQSYCTMHNSSLHTLRFNLGQILDDKPCNQTLSVNTTFESDITYLVYLQCYGIDCYPFPSVQCLESH